MIALPFHLKVYLFSLTVSSPHSRKCIYNFTITLIISFYLHFINEIIRNIFRNFYIVYKV